MMYQEKIRVKDINDTTACIIKEWSHIYSSGKTPMSIEKKNIPDLIKKLNEVK